MISAGFYGVYAELVPAFERATGHHLVTTRGPSMGDSPEAIPARLARGETADVVILESGAADELAKRGLVRAGSKVGRAGRRAAHELSSQPCLPEENLVNTYPRCNP
jgi:molybdate transport system substrate-binding protein